MYRKQGLNGITHPNNPSSLNNALITLTYIPYLQTIFTIINRINRITLITLIGRVLRGEKWAQQTEDPLNLINNQLLHTSAVTTGPNNPNYPGYV